SETFLPELVERHFREAAAGEYRVAVVDRRAPEQVVYAANVTAVGELLAKHDADEDLFGIRPDTVRRAADAMRRLRAPGGESRRAVFSGCTPRRPSGGTPPPARPFEDVRRCRRVARHPAGSLEAAVEEARTRNLLLSFGILLLMAGSV